MFKVIIKTILFTIFCALCLVGLLYILGELFLGVVIAGIIAVIGFSSYKKEIKNFEKAKRRVQFLEYERLMEVELARADALILTKPSLDRMLRQVEVCERVIRRTADLSDIEDYYKHNMEKLAYIMEKYSSQQL